MIITTKFTGLIKANLDGLILLMVLQSVFRTCYWY